jgi:hypothetical protein
MDSSHVALVSMFLKSDGFEMYRCDHKMSLGMRMRVCVYVCVSE